MASSKDFLQVLSATRVHFPAGTLELPGVAVENLKKYAQSIQMLGISGAIAVNCLQEEVESVLTEAAPDAQIRVLHVPVWGAFVAALNALLGEAQRRRFQYILYQSLEVLCAPAVLRKMLDHHTLQTLVVGPVLDGHIFSEGECQLNGRSTPWNTLALWSTQKLGLTGFLSVADGIPDVKGSLPGPGSPVGSSMGSEDWWKPEATSRTSPPGSEGPIPAGVEEVTAIAVLQHLLGEAQTRAVLLQLPEELDRLVSWKTDWRGDEKRRQWHEYKMNTKITRPAAQIDQLFAGKKTKRCRNLCSKRQDNAELLPTESAPPHAQSQPALQTQCGVVHHFKESVRPPANVERICFAVVALFAANFASAFATAFRAINVPSEDDQMVLPAVVFAGLLLGGVYIPMPLSLLSSRWVSSHLNHASGLAMFALVLLIAHLGVLFAELTGQCGAAVLLAARLFAGLGSGVLFQTRFVLQAVSTGDHHLDLQSRTFLASDLGHAVGALLPFATSILASSLSKGEVFSGEMTSAALVVASASVLVWILVSFPRDLYFLPDAVRFSVAAAKNPVAAGSEGNSPVNSPRNRTSDADSTVCNLRLLLASGTARVFVQTAAMFALALWMHEVDMTGDFRQTRAVALLCILPVPLEAVASGVSRCPTWFAKWQRKTTALALVTVAVCLFIASTIALALGSVTSVGRVFLAGLELALLLQALAVAAPQNISKLHKHQDAESSLVTLEWLKAYVGRLLAPVFAVMVQTHCGSGPLFVLLGSATVLVAVTA